MNIELSGKNSFKYKGFEVIISTKDNYCDHYFNGSTLDIDVDGYICSAYGYEYNFCNFDNLKEAIEWVDEVVKNVLEFGVLGDNNE